MKEKLRAIFESLDSDLSFDLALILGDKFNCHYTVIIKEYEEWQIEGMD